MLNNGSSSPSPDQKFLSPDSTTLARLQTTFRACVLHLPQPPIALPHPGAVLPRQPFCPSQKLLTRVVSGVEWCHGLVKKGEVKGEKERQKESWNRWRGEVGGAGQG